MAVKSSLDELRTRRKRHRVRRTILSLALLGGLVWGANQMLVGRPVRKALASDPRTAPIGMVGHLGTYYLNPTILVLDLRVPAVADTNDLFRGVLVVARDLISLSILHQVVLARSGNPVYVLSGDDFRKLGRDFTILKNPVVVQRELADALHYPGGQKVPLVDYGEPARRWAAGGH
jgi:hypothetical protein